MSFMRLWRLSSLALKASLALFWVRSSEMYTAEGYRVSGSGVSSASSWRSSALGSSAVVFQPLRFFRRFRTSITWALVRRLTNFAMIGRGFTVCLDTSPSSLVLGAILSNWPTRWETSISSNEIGGWSFNLLLQRSSSTLSVVPGMSSGTPKTRMAPRRLCCSFIV